MDDRYNASGLCVLEWIGRGSHNNRLLWFGPVKGEITLVVRQFEVEVVVSQYATAQLIKNDILKIE